MAGDVGVVRHHHDRVTGLVQLAKNLQDNAFVGFVQIAGRFIGKNELGLIN